MADITIRQNVANLENQPDPLAAVAPRFTSGDPAEALSLGFLALVATGSSFRLRY